MREDCTQAKNEMEVACALVFCALINREAVNMLDRRQMLSYQMSFFLEHLSHRHQPKNIQKLMLALSLFV